MQVSVTLVGMTLMLQWRAMSLDIMMQVRNNCNTLLSIADAGYHISHVY